jgi:hypothetical protein
MNDTSRDQIRTKVFGVLKPKSTMVTLFGAEIELHQPTLKSILEAQDTEDVMQRMIQMIVNYTYVPGTDEHIFDEADGPMILSWPFGDDLIRLQKAITDLTGLDITKAGEVLTKSPLEEQSSPTP